MIKTYFKSFTVIVKKQKAKKKTKLSALLYPNNNNLY